MKLIANFKNSRDQIEGRIYEREHGDLFVALVSSIDYGIKDVQVFDNKQIEWAYMCAKKFANFEMINHESKSWDVAANYPYGMTNIVQHDGKGWIEIGTAKTEVDAKLMAAAPDLFEALNDLVLAIQFTPLGVLQLKAIEAARAAIAKATGEKI